MTFTCGFSEKVACEIVAEKLLYLPFCYSDSDLNGIIVNQPCNSINGGPLTIKSSHLKEKNFFLEEEVYREKMLVSFHRGLHSILNVK